MKELFWFSVYLVGFLFLLSLLRFLNTDGICVNSTRMFEGKTEYTTSCYHFGATR